MHLCVHAKVAVCKQWWRTSSLVKKCRFCPTMSNQTRQYLINLIHILQRVIFIHMLWLCTKLKPNAISVNVRDRVGNRWFNSRWRDFIFLLNFSLALISNISAKSIQLESSITFIHSNRCTEIDILADKRKGYRIVYHISLWNTGT